MKINKNTCIRFLCLCFLFVEHIVTAQLSVLDSAKLALKQGPDDSTKIRILAFMCDEAPDGEWQSYYKNAGDFFNASIPKYKEGTRMHYVMKTQYATVLVNTSLRYAGMGNYDEAFKRADEAMQLQKEMKDRAGLANSLNNFGFFHYGLSNMTKALEYFKSGLAVWEETGDKAGMGNTLNNIAHVYSIQGNIPMALETMLKGLKVYEDAGNLQGAANLRLGLGQIYSEQGDTAKALENYLAAKKTYEKIDDARGLGIVYSSIGLVQYNQKNYTLSEQSYSMALENYIRCDDRLGIATIYNNFGQAFVTAGDSKEGLEWYAKSLEKYTELSNKTGMANTLANMAWTHMKEKKYALALELANKSMSISKEIGFPSHIKTAASCLYEIHKSLGNFKLSLDNLELLITMRDSIKNESTRKASVRSQLKYEYEKQAAADSVAHAKESEIKNAELKRQNAEIRAKKNQQYALFGGLALVMIFAGFMYNRFKITQNQKRIIESQKEIVEEQKKLVEEKQKEVLDSIHYARRIQLAQIPSDKRVEIILKRLKS